MRAKQKEFDEFFSKMNKSGDDFSKIKDLLHSNNGKDFFLGVRENNLSIYYRGMSFASVNALQKGGCSYTLSYYYLNGVKDAEGNRKYDDKTSGYYSLPSEVFWNKNNLNAIKNNVEKHVFGFGARGYLYLEKVCQQWIINNNNNNPDSDWYYVDMEYIYKEEDGDGQHPFGRADLIAIKKHPNENKKFDVAFIELKVGTGAYGVSIKVPDNIKDAEQRECYRKKVIKTLNKDLWDDKVKAVKLGSGLASHVVDFMHFFAEEKAKDQLRKEILGILQVHKKFGLIDEKCPLYKLDDMDYIELNPDIYIVTYSDVPVMEKHSLSEKAKERDIPTLRKMKDDFGKYFYDGKGSSSLPVEKLINNDQIKGFVNLKSNYLEFINDDKRQIDYTQSINGQNFRFVFRFIDVYDKKVNCVECIE